jgi:very-short-patch-repair endonuclease
MSPLTEALNRKLAAQLEKWQSDLINLTRRNRLVYFGHTKAGSLEIVEPSMVEVFTTLQRSGWDFVAPKDPEDDEEGSVDPTSVFNLEDVEVGRKPNELLVGNKTLARLQRDLKYLDSVSRQVSLDTGLWILYLGFGMLQWTDENKEQHESPLLLCPVQLSREGKSRRFRLTAAEEDLAINPALALKLETDFGIRLPSSEEVELTPRAVCDAVAALVRKRKWFVEDRVVMARFTFHKEAMYRDLVNNAGLISDHPVVRMMGLGSSATFEQPDFRHYADNELDVVVPPEDLASILDADSTQRRCILAARDGTSFVMDGPPGTGKSQTIVNIIVELLRGGKSVLFVSEKAAALEVVYKRLAAANLTEFVLEIHSDKATRKEVAHELGRALEERPRATSRFTATDRQNLIRLRKQLTDYAVAMNEVRQPLGHSLHYAIGRVALLQHLPHAPVPAAIDRNLTPEALSELLDGAERLSRAWGPVIRGDDYLWRDLAEVHVSAANKQRIVAIIDAAAEALQRLDQASNDLAEQLSFERPPNLAEAMRLRDLASAASEYRARSQVPVRWLTTSELTPISTTLTERQHQIAEALAAEDAMEAIGGSRWRDVVGFDQSIFEEALPSVLDLGDPGLLDWQAPELEAVCEVLNGALSRLESIAEDSGIIASAFRVPSTELSFVQCERLAELACQIGATTPPEGAWLNPLSQVALTEAESVLVPLVEGFRNRRERLKEVFTDEVLDLDLERLRTRLQSQSGLSKLSSSYRSDKRLLAATVVSGRVTKAVIGRLDDAVTWKQLNDQLQREESVHGSLLGRYYSGPLETDLDRLDRAIELARKALAVADEIPPQVLAAQIGADGSPDPDTLLAGQRLKESIEGWHQLVASDLTRFARESLDTSPSQVRKWAAALSEALGRLGACLNELEGRTGRALTPKSSEALLKQLDTYQSGLDSLEHTGDDDRLLFGSDYDVLASDFDALSAHLEWAKGVRETHGGPLRERVAMGLANDDFSPSRLSQCLVSSDKATGALLDLFVKPWQDRLHEDLSVSFEFGRLMLEKLRNTVGDIDEWSRFSSARADLNGAGLTESIDFLVDRRVPDDEVRGAAERVILEAWIDSVIDDDQRLGTLSAADRDDLRRRFLRLDQDLVSNASASVINACSDRRPDTTLGAAGTIRREANKLSRHKPIRELLAETWEVAVALKPCFMMSPLTVSRFLPSDVKFDVVIFDEASQVTPADAVSSIYRGHQIIVAGDQLQLPPTNFFDRQSGSDDEDAEAPDDFESVLDALKGTALPGLPLQWHYRSQHEHLITYSNYRFYEGRLHTFPGAVETRSDLGVEFIHVNGVYRRGASRDNPIEASAVVDRVLHHRREHPELTMGVVAFSSAQQDAILTEIERRMADEPELRVLRFDDRLDGFFVKNLENVQGDDRDIIIFGIGYGPDENGSFTENLGPLSKEGGHRRLNVAITRARRKVDVVSSVRAGDFPGTSEMKGVRHLQRYLDFAERGIVALSLDLSDSLGDAESPFEEAVIAAVFELGFDPVPQVGVAGYRIDIGIRHPQRPGEFVLGIECDGAQYHSSKVARDRDRLRQTVLEGLGWRIHRIWGPSWYRDRTSQVEALRDAISSAIQNASAGPMRPSVPRTPTVEIHEAELDARPSWVSDYNRSNWTPHAGDVAAASLAEISSGVVRIVSDEGPIYREQVLHRLKEAYGRIRLTTQLREILEPKITAAIRRGEVEVIDTHFLRIPGEEIKVRVPPDGDDNPRPITEICPSERQLALTGLVNESLSIDQDELVRAVARLFGWRRSSEEITTTLQRDLKKLRKSGDIVI